MSKDANPAFVDVPCEDPDFDAIQVQMMGSCLTGQGLAETGYVASKFTGGVEVEFRPNAEITREELIELKVLIRCRFAVFTIVGRCRLSKRISGW